jgi:hypothetical protein
MVTTDLGKGTGGMILEGKAGKLLYFGPEPAISEDRGRTWTPQPNLGQRQNTVMRLDDGRLMICIWNEQPRRVKEAGLNGTTYDIGFSEDEGLTLSERIPINEEEGCFYVMNDRFLRLSTGRILLAMSRHPDEDFGKKVEQSCIAASAYSEDEGRTWRFSNWVGDNYQEPMCVELSDGRVLMFVRSTKGYLFTYTSHDHGESWGEERQTDINMPTAPFTVKKDPFSGYIFLVWDHSMPSAVFQYPRCPIRMAVSRDECKTFDIVTTLDANPDHSYGYPALHFTQDEIFVNYYENAFGRTFMGDKHRVKLRILKRKDLTYERIERRPLFE